MTVEVLKPYELSPEQKLDHLRDQILEVQRGDRSSIRCPYCDGKNKMSDKLWCCPTGFAAMQAILDRMDKQAGIDAIHQIGTAVDNATRRIN